MADRELPGALASGGTGTFAPPHAKIRPPRTLGREARRTALLDRIAASGAEILAFSAPAGFGKTTTMLQWVATSDRPIVWITLDSTDSDPIVFMSTTLAAFAEAGCPPLETLTRADGIEPDFSRRVRPAFLRSIESIGVPVTLVVDDVHEVDSPVTLGLLSALHGALPAGSHVALAGRTLSGLPVDRWRGRGQVLEIDASDLPFDPKETEEALAAFGASTDTARQIHERSEGWPVVVYLSTLRDDPTVSIQEYLEQEVLGALPGHLVPAMRDLSLVDAVDASLGGALLGEGIAGRVLRDAARATPLVRRIDGAQVWYRMHPLLLQVLAADLSQTEPGHARELHRRASTWYAGQGHPEQAVHHALLTDDPEFMGRIAWRSAMWALTAGRVSTVERWLSPLPADVVARNAGLALSAAFAAVLRGNPARVLSMAMAAAVSVGDGWETRDDPDLVCQGLAVLAALDSSTGYEGAARLAGGAFHRLPPDSPMRPVARLVQAANQLLAGEVDEATRHLRQAALLAKGLSPTSQVDAYSFQALAAAQRGDLEGLSRLAGTAEAAWSAERLQDAAPSTALYRAAALVAGAARGSRATMSTHLRQLPALSDQVSYLLPWFRSLENVATAHAHLLLEDVDSARRSLAAFQHTRLDIPRSPFLDQWYDRLDAQVTGALPLAALSPAERRVWDQLQTRMTLTEIGQRMYLSRETVKTHAGSIYRKLGVQSRREALDLAESWQSPGS